LRVRLSDIGARVVAVGTAPGGHVSTRESSEHHRPRSQEEPEAAPASSATARKEELDAEVDALLDEIDDVLEENAEEFVRGFVQKGGE
jgi:ubiquitin-like protein Pup